MSRFSGCWIDERASHILFEFFPVIRQADIETGNVVRHRDAEAVIGATEIVDVIVFVVPVEHAFDWFSRVSAQNDIHIPVEQALDEI